MDAATAKGDVHHLDHFVVAVMDPERAEKFYSEVLGARTLKYENSPDMTRVFMKLGENHVGLFSQGKATLPKRDNADSYPRHSLLVPEAEYEPMAARIRRGCSYVRDFSAERNLGCPWSEGLVFQDSEGNFFEIAKASGLSRTRLHHLHFDTTDLAASVDFYTRFLNCAVQEQKSGVAVVAVPSAQCVVLHRVDELSEVTQTAYRGRHFAFTVTDENFRAIVAKLRAAGIAERDEHGERAGRRPGQLGTYFKEPSGFRLQITNEDSAEFARQASD
ncbi:MAG TPA: VOC family protein [Candidatus Binatia bacterium]|nr:VOC family protein [Candidatus Binatia bacterium]